MEILDYNVDIKNQILCSGKSTIACTFCPKTFHEIQAFALHQLDHTCENKYRCECGKSFKQRFSLTRHQRIHANERNHICPDCGKGFNERGDLIRHGYIHSHERSTFPCVLCGKNLINLHNLKYHLKVKHGVIDDLVCSFCFKPFNDEQSLAYHKESNACAKSFTCNTCGKSFRSNLDLERHERIHTGMKPFICKECGKSFSLKSTLVCHLRTHTGRKPYICSKCGKKFSQNGNMHQHLRKKHGNNSTKKVMSTNDGTNESHKIIKESVKVRIRQCLRGNNLFTRARDKCESQELSEKISVNPKPQVASSVLKSDFVEHESSKTVKSNKLDSSIHSANDVQESGNSETFCIFFRDSDKQNMSTAIRMISEQKYLQRSHGLDSIKFVPEMLSKTDIRSNEESSFEQKDSNEFLVASNTFDVIKIESGNCFTNCANFNEANAGSKELLTANQLKQSPKTKQLPKIKQHDKCYSTKEQIDSETLNNSFQSKQYQDFLKSMVKISSKLFSCPICSKTFSKLGNLKEHIFCHNDKPFHCKLCDFCCTSPRGLSNHTKTHSTNRHTFNCFDCNYGFYTQTDLIRHNRIHTGEKPFQCAICGRCFSLKSSLVIHERTHTGEKPYICPVCQKRFAQNSNMKQHVKRHNKQNSRELI